MSARAFMNMTLKMDREDNPQLYDDLARFRKGAKRMSRLRLLAYQGLLVEQGTQSMTTKPSGPKELADDGTLSLVCDLLGPAIGDL